MIQDLNNIIEDLARRSHEQWAADRIRDGWRYAPQRDNAAKKHPLLLPYEQLTEDVSRRVSALSINPSCQYTQHLSVFALRILRVRKEIVAVAESKSK